MTEQEIDKLAMKARKLTGELHQLAWNLDSALRAWRIARPVGKGVCWNVVEHSAQQLQEAMPNGL